MPLMKKRRIPRRRSKSSSRIYKRMPRGYKPVDAARDAQQARSLRASWPKDANAIIVKTGPSRGKRRHVFPYTIASNNRLYGG